MLILTYDTETTGKLDFKAPSHAEHQPRIVQLAAILTDERRHTLAEMNVLIQPDGWTIPADTAAIHGITTERAAEGGIPIILALLMFERLFGMAQVHVAHNKSFDEKMLRGEFRRQGKEWKVDGTGFCTMNAMVSICRLPFPSGRGGFKWPTLGEAYQHAFGKPLEGAHDGRVDARAACDLYYWLKQRGSAAMPIFP